MMALEGASFGLQLGGQATDFVLLLMNDRSVKGVLTSKVKLGADASAAAAPRVEILPQQPTPPSRLRSLATREPAEPLLEYRGGLHTAS